MLVSLNDRLLQFPDYLPHPGRVLVRTDVGADVKQAGGESLGLRKLAQLGMQRANQLSEVLVLDGPRTLLSKAKTMVRREELAFSRRSASFSGWIEEDRTQQPRERGLAVVGFSLKHPALTELVVTRPEHLWQAPPDSSPHLGALTLHGGVARMAVTLAAAERQRIVGVVGTGLLAELVVALLVQDGVPVVRYAQNAEPLRYLRVEAPTTTSFGAAEVWIAAGSGIPDSDVEIPVAIGCDVPAEALRSKFSRALEHHPLSLRDMLTDERWFLDPFYDDGPCTYPEWFDLAQVARYVEALPRLSESFADRRHESQGQGHPQKYPDVRMYAFSGHERRPTHAVVRRDAGETPGSHGVSLVGGGRWPIGMIVRQLVRHPDIELRTVCDRRPEVAYLAAKAMPFTAITTDRRTVLDDADTGTVVVAPYHGVHAPMAAEALRAGKNCFVEKPPVIDDTQLKELTEAAISSSKLLYVGYNRRFAPVNDTLIPCLEAETGPLAMQFFMRSIDVDFNNWYRWPSNGSRLIGNVCHMTDYALFIVRRLTSGLPVEVTTTPAGVGRHDANVVVSLRFSEGSLATLFYTDRGRVKRGYFQRYLLARGGSFAEIDNFTTLKVRREGTQIASWRGVRDQGHRRQVATFADAVATGGPPPVPLFDTLVSARTILATERSVATRAAVELDFSDLPADR